jgi:hypothetical protein
MFMFSSLFSLRDTESINSLNFEVDRVYSIVYLHSELNNGTNSRIKFRILLHSASFVLGESIYVHID